MHLEPLHTVERRQIIRSLWEEPSCVAGMAGKLILAMIITRSTDTTKAA
jgi:hypothetical protein